MPSAKFVGGHNGFLGDMIRSLLDIVLVKVENMAHVDVQKTGNADKEKERQALEEMKFNLNTNQFSTTGANVQTYAALSKHRNRSMYKDILDSQRNNFYDRWRKTNMAATEGLDDFKKIRTLGSGSFGRVFLVKHLENNNNVFYAMKAIDKKRIVKLKQVDHTLYEKRILEAVQYPFIISLEYTFKDNSYVYFVMPFINGGEMFTHLRRMRRFTETLSRFYGAQVLLALEYLHYCDVLYRDLKPENIIIDIKGYIKIVDLGFCKVVKGRTWTLCGTPEYIAPEIILSKGYGKAVDWWSFGVLLFELNAGYPPFTSKDTMRVYEKIISCRYKCPGSFTMELQDIIRHLLQLDLSRRYGNLKNGTEDLRSHRWFKDIDWLALYNGNVEPPFKPTVKSVDDTSNFDNVIEEPFKISVHNMCEEEFANF